MTAMKAFGRTVVFGTVVLMAWGRGPLPASSQSAPPAPDPAQLEKLVAPIAL